MGEWFCLLRPIALNALVLSADAVRQCSACVGTPIRAESSYWEGNIIGEVVGAEMRGDELWIRAEWSRKPTFPYVAAAVIAPRAPDETWRLFDIITTDHPLDSSMGRIPSMPFLN